MIPICQKLQKWNSEARSEWRFLLLSDFALIIKKKIHNFVSFLWYPVKVEKRVLTSLLAVNFLFSSSSNIPFVTQTVLVLLENSTHGDVITNLVKGWNQHQIRLSTSIMDKERRSYDKRTTFGQQQNPMFAFLLRSIKQIHIIKTNKPLVKNGKKFC